MPAAFAKHRPRFRPTPLPRPSAAQRGYGTDWRALRELVRKTGECGPYQCTEPGCRCNTRLHLDHKKPREQGGSDDPSNLQWKCPSHHSRKTSATDGGFGNPIKVDR